MLLLTRFARSAATMELDQAKRDPRIAAYGGVLLQRFEFIKACMGRQRFCLEKLSFGGFPLQWKPTE